MLVIVQLGTKRKKKERNACEMNVWSCLQQPGSKFNRFKLINSELICIIKVEDVTISDHWLGWCFCFVFLFFLKSQNPFFIPLSISFHILFLSVVCSVPKLVTIQDYPYHFNTNGLLLTTCVQLDPERKCFKFHPTRSKKKVSIFQKVIPLFNFN